MIKLTRFILIVAVVMLLLIPFGGIAAYAENDPLYIDITVSSKVYDNSPISLNIEFYEDLAHLIDADVDMQYVDISYYLSDDEDLLNALPSAPKDAGEYKVVVKYSDDINKYQDTEEVAFFNITKRYVALTVSSYPIYGNAPIWNHSSPSQGSYASGESYTDLGIDYSYMEDNINVGTYTSGYSVISNDNYTASLGWLLVISAKAISLTIRSEHASIIYGNAFNVYAELNSGSELQYDDVIDDLNLTYRLNGVEFIDEDLSIYNAGSYTLSAIKNNNNYSITYTTTTLTINRFLLNVNVSGTSVYGTIVNDQSIYTVNLVNGVLKENVDYPYDDDYSDVGLSFYVDNSKPNVGSMHTIRSTNTNANYLIALVDAKLNVTPRDITATIDDKTYVYGIPPQYTITLSEGYSYAVGDNINSLQVVFNPMSQINVGTYNITAQANSPNYNVEFIEGTLTVTPRTISVIVPNSTFTYGSLIVLQHSLAPGYSMSYMDSYASLGIVVTASEIRVGTYDADISYDNDNYNVLFQGGQYTITKKSIEIKINDAYITYGEVPQYSCYVWGETLSNGDQLEDLNINFVPESLNYGQRYAINGSYNNPNYNVIFREGRLDVSKRPITVIIDDITVTYGTTPQFTYRLAEGSTVAPWDTLSSLNIVCSSTGHNFVDAPITITREYNNPNYNITFVDGLHVIDKRDITIKVKDIVKQYGQDKELNHNDIEIVSGNMAFGEPLSALSLNFSGADIGAIVGVYTVTVTTDNSNYNVTVIDGKLTINKRKVRITPLDITKAFGDKDPVIAFESNVEGVVFTGKLSREEGETAGSYLITIGTLSAGDNYQLDLNTAYFNINDDLTPISFVGIGSLALSLIGAIFMVVRKLLGSALL